jgi:hypothetical protein
VLPFLVENRILVVLAEEEMILPVCIWVAERNADEDGTVKALTCHAIKAISA